MGKVRLLTELVASQVAAGEVVDRPASVLKELVENSLDAGASRVEIEVSRGGSGVIRVRDDGCGMDREDALLSLERHATSKIRTGEDLDRIETFGFRGEAVPSIASVSRFRMVTRMRDGQAGTEILIEGGRLHDVRESGDAPGTLIEVQTLFFNLPARKKFLRSEITESAHLLQTFQTLALAHPEVAFTYTKDGKMLHRLGAAEGLPVRVRDLLGQEWAENLYDPGTVCHGGIQVAGLLAKPAFFRADRSGQFFYLNRRPVRDAAILRGLRAGGGDGRQAAGILFLEMSPDQFDCNVHPAKREVRFRRPDEVSVAVEAFVRLGVPHPDAAGERGAAEIPTQNHESDTALITLVHPLKKSGFPPKENTQLVSVEINTKTENLDGETGEKSQEGDKSEAAEPEKFSPEEKETEETQVCKPEAVPEHQEFPEFSQERNKGCGEAPDFSFRGVLGKRYFLWESEEGLVLMHIRNATERIYYDAYFRNKQNDPHPAQRLLVPLTLKLAPKDTAWVAENTKALLEFGFSVEPFGADVVKIDAVPAGTEGWSPEELLLRLVDETRHGMKSSARRFLHDQFALSLSVLRARTASVPPEDAPQLLANLFACEMPYTSPAGSPTLLQIGWQELERKF